MSYQAIARKWRPGTFEEIAGQGHVTRTLQNALRLKRIHHAFLFTGARGVGKTTAARTLARCLNCVEGPTAVPCGVCPSCQEVPLGSSPDVTEIDGASNNSVDDVRELRDAVRYLPGRDRYRVYIIDEVHMLSLGAFNALLKTLEEPPAHVVFIFATTEPQKIPDTILSRVQRFDFKRIPEATVVARLAHICASEGVAVPESGLRLIARAGEGSMRDAQSLLDQVIAFGGQSLSVEQVADILGMVDRELLYGFLEGLVRGEPDRCLDIIARVHDYGYEHSQFTSETLELLRNAALVVLSPRARAHVDVPAEELSRLEAICEGVSAPTFARLFQAMLAVHDEVSRTSRPRLVLEMSVARLSAIRELQPVDHLLARLEDLERRLRGGGHAPRPGPAPRAERVARQPAPIPRAPATAAQAPAPPPQAPATAAQAPAPTPIAPPAPAPAPPRAEGRPEPVDAPPPAEPHWADDDEEDDGQAPPPDDAFAPPRGEPRPSARGPAAPAAEAPLPDPLPASASDEERFHAFTRALEAAGQLRLERLARNLAPPQRVERLLRLPVPREHLARTRPLADDPAVLRLAARLYPGVDHLEVCERQAGATVKEVRAERLRQHEAAVEAEVRADPRVKALQEVLGARILRVQTLSVPEDP